jgi:hypothetical protein
MDVSRSKLHQGILTSAAIVCCSALLPAAAQSPQGQYRQNTGNMWGAPAKTKTNENIQMLKDSPELPQLPSYSGKSKFYHGYVQPAEKGWTNYQLTYFIKEPPIEVKDWYQSAFNSYQWTTIRASSQTLSANHKDGHICSVVINRTNEPGYKTLLSLYYNLAPSKTASHN